MPAAAGANYQPALLRSATVLYLDEKKKINSRVTVTVANAIDTANAKVDWDQFCDVPRDIDLGKLDNDPADGASFGELPAAAEKAATYAKIAKDFPAWVYANIQAEVHYAPLLGAYSNVGESQADFRVRVTQTARELRDKAVEELRAKLGKQAKSIQDDLERAIGKLQSQKAASSSATLSTVAQIGASLLGSFLGRKSSVVTATTINKAGSAYKDSQQANRDRRAGRGSQEPAQGPGRAARRGVEEDRCPIQSRQHHPGDHQAAAQKDEHHHQRGGHPLDPAGLITAGRPRPSIRIRRRRSADACRESEFRKGHGAQPLPDAPRRPPG